MTERCDPDLFGYEEAASYPDAPGFRRSAVTSREAAESIAPSLGRLQRLALDSIAGARANGLTAHELADATALPREAMQPRLSELRKKGLIVDSAQRRFNANGKRAIVWTLPQFKRSEP